MDSRKGLIAVATSIPPVLKRQDAGRNFIGYQKLCVQSWTSNGFRILSINDPDEIQALTALYPDVEFIAAHRSGGFTFGLQAVMSSANAWLTTNVCP